MGQDLRDLLKEERSKRHSLKKGHEERFVERLEEAFPPQKRRSTFFFMKIAASIVVLVSIGFFVYQGNTDDEIPTTTVVKNGPDTTVPQGISLGDLSPDLKRVEEYYVATINMELSNLELSNDNKIIVDDFMDRLGELNKEYKVLNIELNTIGPNDQTINALIQNLQLRLQLLLKLKEKLNQLKSSKNETVTTTSV